MIIFKHKNYSCQLFAKTGNIEYIRDIKIRYLGMGISLNLKMLKYTWVQFYRNTELRLW